MTHALLEYYVRIAEEHEWGEILSVYVNGLIIEGTTISHKTYYKDIWSELTSQEPADEASKKIMDSINISLGNFIKSQTENENTRRPSEYIYLADVSIYSDSTVNFKWVPFWVGKLSAIDGFSFGSYPPQQPESTS